MPSRFSNYYGLSPCTSHLALYFPPADLLSLLLIKGRNSDNNQHRHRLESVLPPPRRGRHRARRPHLPRRRRGQGVRPSLRGGRRGGHERLPNRYVVRFPGLFEKLKIFKNIYFRGQGADRWPERHGDESGRGRGVMRRFTLPSLSHLEEKHLFSYHTSSYERQSIMPE